MEHFFSRSERYSGSDREGLSCHIHLAWCRPVFEAITNCVTISEATKKRMSQTLQKIELDYGGDLMSKRIELIILE